MFRFLKTGISPERGFGGETTGRRRAHESLGPLTGVLRGFKLCSFASLLKWASFECSKKFDEQSEKKKNGHYRLSYRNLHSNCIRMYYLSDVEWPSCIGSCHAPSTSTYSRRACITNSKKTPKPQPPVPLPRARSSRTIARALPRLCTVIQLSTADLLILFSPLQRAVGPVRAGVIILAVIEGRNRSIPPHTLPSIFTSQSLFGRWRAF